MKRSILPMVALSLVLCGCADSETPASSSEVQSSLPSVTPTAPPSNGPSLAPSASAATGTNATCNDIEFYLDPSLATSIACESVPEGVWAFDLIFPAHTEVTLQGYPLVETTFSAQIMVYPVERFDSLNPDWFPRSLESLRLLTNSEQDPAGQIPMVDAEAGHQFSALQKIIPAIDGAGIRFITVFGDSTETISNEDLVYVYQGLIDGEQYWVSVYLPVSHPTLPANGVNGPEGWMTETYEEYFLKAVADLDSLPMDSFTPTLDALDALVASITVAP